MLFVVAPIESPWKNPNHKLERLTVQFGNDVPWCLWFYLGKDPSEQERAAAIESAKALFDKEVAFGDIELHQSSTKAVSNHIVMRVRDAARVAAELKTSAGTFPLYLANGGNSSDQRHVDFTSI